MNISSKLSLLCGAILIALGGFVVFAWLTNNVLLIQVRPTLVPMSIPVATGFMLNGFGLIFLNCFRFRVTQAIGVLVLILAGFAVLDFILSFTSAENSPFRPMAPMTAFGFSLAGLGFFAGSDKRSRPKGTLIYGVLGTVVFAIGALALFAHLLDLSPTEGWGHFIRMAVHAPGGFWDSRGWAYFLCLAKRTTKNNRVPPNGSPFLLESESSPSP